MIKIKTSYRFRARLKLHKVPAYQIAQIAGVNPATLSKLVCGVIEVLPGDPRIISVGRVLGLKPEECFERMELTESEAMIPGRNS